MHRSPPDGDRLPRRRRLLGHLARPRTWTMVAALACTAAAMLPTGTRADLTPPAAAAPVVGQGFVVTPSDLAFILTQIKIAERHSRALAGTEPTALPNPNPLTDPVYCQSMVGTGPGQIPSRLLSFGLRTVDGSCNNLIPGSDKFGAADQIFPRLTNPSFRPAEDSVPGFGPIHPTSYAQTSGSVFDSQPRTISNLIVDQTVNNPAAVEAAGYPVRTQGAPGVFSCVGIGETQTITGTPSATYSINFNGQQTGPIAAGADAATIQAALIALSNLAPGDVTVTGSLPSNLAINFSPSLGDVPQVALLSGVTGLTLATTTDGALGSPVVPGTSELQTLSGNPFVAAIPGTPAVATIDASAATGDFTLTFNGIPTALIPVGSLAAVVQAELNAAPVSAGVTVVDGAAPATYTITFGVTGPQPAITADAGLVVATVAGIADVPAVTDFTLTFNGNTTAPIPAGSLASVVEAALNAAPVSAGVTVVDGLFPATYLIAFIATGPQSPITTNSLALTGVTTTLGVATIPAGPNTSEVQTLSGTASAPFTLDLSGTPTAPIAPTALAAGVATALNAITTVTTGGGPLPAAVTITFDGALGNVAQLSVPGSGPVGGVTSSTVRNGVAANSPGCVPPNETLFIPNVTTDVGLSPPFNSLFTIFGQFFDHGLDKITNGGNGSVFVPLKADDPLFLVGPDGLPGTGDELTPGAPNAFMVVTRAKNFPGPGPDGILGNGDDTTHEALNTDSPFVDQSQTYTSHSSHQIFLRDYVNNTAGKPVSTGKLLSSTDGGQANWKEVKAQAATSLGIQLTDADVGNIPMLAADPYGNFIPSVPGGLPQLVAFDLTTADPNDTRLVEGSPGVGIPLNVPGNYQAVRIQTAFLNDIAHSAAPTFSAPGVLFPDTDSTVGSSLATPVPAGSYDNELLDEHFICGDGRCNENIALTAVHQIFHSEHDRLVGAIKQTLLADTSGVTTLSDWQTALGAPDGADTWNGERLFQAARFVTEMEYQHLVFEEFARKIQPLINPFAVFAFNQTDVNPAIRAEFAHAVYRFGHSMLTQTIPRLNENGTTNPIPLLGGFLNPVEYHNGGPAGPLTSEQAAGAIIMGLSDQAGNEIDEFVTNTLRNNLVGLPLDLPAINMARARSEGIPPLNDVRRQLFAATNDGQVAPYGNWIDFGLGLKHPASLINFVAAYGTHATITAPPNTLASKRAAATLLVDPPLGTDPASIPPDAADFMAGQGIYAADKGGLENVDLWMGGLAERTNLFGGHLGSTFNFVFEKQLTDLQNGDRLYYLARTPGMNLRTQLEGNSFAELVMRNTPTHSLKADAFATADCKFELGRLTFPTATSTAVNDDPLSECDEHALLIRTPDGTIRYREYNSVNPPGINGQSVYNGTAGVDRIFGGNDNDTFWGNDGNDTIEGNGGADIALGGNGDDVITDSAGDDVPKGGPGNDAIDGGPGLDIVMGGTGKDFTNGGANINETFAGAGDDFVIAGQGEDFVAGDAGNDWIEGGDAPDGLAADASNLFFTDSGSVPGNDVLIGQGGDDDYDMEGGDDIGVAGPGIEKVAGAAGYDWQIGQSDPQAQNMDLALPLIGVDILTIDVRDKFNEAEALSGWKFNDTLRGDSITPSALGGAGFLGCDALDKAGVDRIAGLGALVDVTAFPSGLTPIRASTAVANCPLVGEPATTAVPAPAPDAAGFVWGEGNILLGGSGSDLLEGRGANDILDGDRYLGVRLSVHSPGTGTEIASTDLMEHAAVSGNFGGLVPVVPSMTLQQAVFARIVNPGDIYIVRELLNDVAAPAAADCAAIAPANCDTAAFTGALSEYTITQNTTGFLAGSITVDHQCVGVGRKCDGIDTLWNIEQLRFLNNPVVGAVPPVPTTILVSGLLAPTAPAASLSAASLAFGSQVVATTSAPQVITVTNTGGTPLIVSGATLAGVDAAEFSIVNNCTTVGAGGSCTISVTFTPTTAVAKTAELSIASNAAGSPSVVGLTGTGVAVAGPAGTTVTIAGPTGFGARRIGTTTTKTVRVTNTGATPLTIASVSTTGPFTADLGTCNVVVAAAGNCRLNVTYTPTAPLGPQSGTVTIVSDAANSPTSADLTGTSRAAAPPVVVVVVAAFRIAQPPAPTALRPVIVSVNVSAAATVRFQVRRTNGKLVWQQVRRGTAAGTHRARWNLRDSNGRRVKAGRYLFTVTATDAAGARVVVRRTVRVR